MFGNLRVGTPLYVLYKNEPRVDTCEVQEVGIPTPLQNMTFQSGIMQPQRMVVDVKVRLGEQVIDLQKLPSDCMIADFGNDGMVVSESRDMILNELTTLRKVSEGVIESVDKHKKRVDTINSIIEDLNPAVRQEAEQRKEIDGLKLRMDSMSDDMTDIKGMLTKLLNKKSKED